ncbi:MAG TPA: hypothetical protein VMV61_05060 [Patescibacteria group bacterium]|nr:hypothetical protein [Patescibacteria group bacterium]
MKKLALVLLGLALCGTALAGQDEKAKPEAYSGVAMGVGGTVGGSSTWFRFEVNHYTTDEEVKQLALLLKEKGQHALQDALDKADVGRIAPTGKVGDQIAVARKLRINGKTVIRIVTARNMSFLEVRNAGRSTDYPFGYLEVTLNDKGEGVGQFILAAKLKFNQKKGHYELESLGNQYVKARNVRPEK